MNPARFFLKKSYRHFYCLSVTLQDVFSLTDNEHLIGDERRGKFRGIRCHFTAIVSRKTKI